jgi:hypothetical protein
VLTLVFRAYLTEQSMDHLSAALKKGGIKDLLAFFPPNKRETKYLEEHFKKEGLPQVADWWTKKQYAALKETLIKELSEMIEREESTDQVIRCFSESRCSPFTFFRLLLPLKLVNRNPLCPKVSWFSASGKASWAVSIGAPEQTRLKASRSAKSP